MLKAETKEQAEALPLQRHRRRSNLKHRTLLEKIRAELISKRFNLWQAVAIILVAYLAYLLMVHFSSLPPSPPSDGLG